LQPNNHSSTRAVKDTNHLGLNRCNERGLCFPGGNEASVQPARPRFTCRSSQLINTSDKHFCPNMIQTQAMQTSMMSNKATARTRMTSLQKRRARTLVPTAISNRWNKRRPHAHKPPTMLFSTHSSRSSIPSHSYPFLAYRLHPSLPSSLGHRSTIAHHLLRSLGPDMAVM